MTYLAGIQQLAPGYAEVRIDPQLPEDMEYMHVSMDTVRGVVEVRCRRENGKVLTKISAPEEIRVIR